MYTLILYTSGAHRALTWTICMTVSSMATTEVVSPLDVKDTQACILKLKHCLVISGRVTYTQRNCDTTTAARQPSSALETVLHTETSSQQRASASWLGEHVDSVAPGVWVHYCFAVIDAAQCISFYTRFLFLSFRRQVDWAMLISFTSIMQPGDTHYGWVSCGIGRLLVPAAWLHCLPPSDTRPSVTRWFRHRHQSDLRPCSLGLRVYMQPPIKTSSGHGIYTDRLSFRCHPRPLEVTTIPHVTFGHVGYCLHCLLSYSCRQNKPVGYLYSSENYQVLNWGNIGNVCFILIDGW